MRILNQICIYLILGLRPLLGPTCCKYSVSCTTYAIIQLKEKPFIFATWAIIKRLMACNPLNRK